MLLDTILLFLYVVGYLFFADRLMNLFWKVIKINATNNNLFLSIFYNVLVFSLVIVTLISIIIARGKTVFLINVPLLYLLFMHYKRLKVHPHCAKDETGKATVWLSVLALSAVTIVLSYYFSLKFSMRNDVAHYVKIAECLVKQGIENPYQYYNAENMIFNGMVPYHYFEIWLGGIIFKFNHIIHLDLSNYICYIFVVYNLFRVLFFIGLFGLITKYLKFKWIYFLIVIPLMLLDISAFNMWWTQFYIAESNFFERPNFIFYYVFIISVFDAVLDQERRRLLIWVLISIICSITVLPAFGGALFVVFLLDFYFNREKRNEIKVNFIYYCSIIIAILLMYKLFPISKEIKTIEDYSFSQILTKLSVIWKACVFMFVVLFIKIGLLIALIWILTRIILVRALKIKLPLNHLILFVLLINLCGIGAFQSVPFIDNMYQLAFVGYCAAITLAGFILALMIAKANFVQKMTFTTMYLLVVAYGINRNLFYDHTIVQHVNWECRLGNNFLMQYNLSESYIDQLKNNSSILSKQNGASMIDGKDALNEFLGLRYSAIYQLGFYLMVFINNVHLPLVSDPNMLYPDEDKSSKDYYKAINFNKFTEFYSHYNSQLDYKANLMSYIKNKNIKFLFASKSFNSNVYFDSLQVSNVIKDTKKGHQLIMLK